MRSVSPQVPLLPGVHSSGSAAAWGHKKGGSRRAAACTRDARAEEHQPQQESTGRARTARMLRSSDACSGRASAGFHGSARPQTSGPACPRRSRACFRCTMRVSSTAGPRRKRLFSRSCRIPMMGAGTSFSLQNETRTPLPASQPLSEVLCRIRRSSLRNRNRHLGGTGTLLGGGRLLQSRLLQSRLLPIRDEAQAERPMVCSASMKRCARSSAASSVRASA